MNVARMLRAIIVRVVQVEGQGGASEFRCV